MKNALLLSIYFSFCFAVYNNQCVSSPNTTNCENYQLPRSVVNTDINSLCGQMNSMSGCTIKTICSNPEYSSNDYCDDFSILKLLCENPSMEMEGCENYKSMCANGTVVQQCEIPTISIPSDIKLFSKITGICSGMEMKSCTNCDDMFSCDLLTTYSNLCKEMPTMAQCKDWESFCEEVPDWPICTTQIENPPAMRMFFHTGIIDYVLFEAWVPRNSGQYFGSWIAIFTAGILLEVIRLVKYKCEKKWKLQSKKEAFRNFDPRIEIPRALLRFLEFSWSYLLMLVVMSFNIGFFFAVTTGVAVGTLLFGRLMFVEPLQKTDCCDS